MIKNILVVVGLACLLIIFLLYSADHDRKVQRAAEAYEKCIAAEFNGRTPTDIYQTTGVYPECGEK